MNDLSAPPVPQLNKVWIATHRRQLVRELTTVRRWHVSRRLAVSGIGALAAAGAAAAAIVIVFSGVHASNAFAGWTATPTRPASGQTASALTQCTSRLASSASGQSAIPASGWQPVVTDTRGPFTAMILQSGGATASCLTGPSFTTTLANAAQGGSSQHVMSSGSSSAGQPTISVMGLGGPSPGPISQATQEQATINGGQPYTFLQGQLQPDVTAVTLVLSDTSQVQATIADGSLVAWWPGNAQPTTAQATTSSGVTTQQLSFTPLNPSHRSSTSSQNSSSSSTASPAQLRAQMLTFSACMRSHGLPNFYPATTPNGRYSTNSNAPDLNPNSPGFQSAAKACAKSLQAAQDKAANGG
jgi:hypothetical protein